MNKTRQTVPPRLRKAASDWGNICLTGCPSIGRGLLVTDTLTRRPRPQAILLMASPTRNSPHSTLAAAWFQPCFANCQWAVVRGQLPESSITTDYCQLPTDIHAILNGRS